MALTERALPGLHEGKIMKRLMNRIRQGTLARKVLAGGLASLYMGLALVPAAEASDSEVYARKIAVTSELSPTMMMMIDTSGSMDWCLSGASSGCTTTNPKRSVALRNAMQKILFGATGVDRVPGYVRMGLARYHPTDGSKGGKVLYPARPLDSFVNINPNGTVTSTVSASAEDAEQVGGSLSLNSTELELGQGNVGLHFTAVDIPKGATVNDAYVEFTASRNVTGVPAVWEVHANDVADAPVFASGVNDVDSRTYALPPASVESVTADWVTNSKYRLSVTEPLNYLANKSDWCGGNAVALRIRRPLGSSVDRYAYAYDGDSTKAPRLVVNYTVDPKKTDSCLRVVRTTSLIEQTGDDDYEYTENATSAASRNTTLNFAQIASSKRNQVVFRFSKSPSVDLEIPFGAEILDAKIHAAGSNTVSSVPNLLIGYFDTANFGSLSGSNLPSTTVAGETAYTLPSSKVTTGVMVDIPVTTMMQTIVNKAAWTPDNAVGFRLRSSATTNTSSTAAFQNFEATTSLRPTLEVKYRISVTDLSKLKTVRDELWQEIQALDFTTNTPLGAAYVETMRYMMGLPVYAPVVDPRTTVDQASVTYQSPIKSDNQCSGNFVFALTDGEPTTNANVDLNSKGVLNNTTCPTSLTNYPVYPSTDTYKTLWQCMQAVAEWGLKPTNQVKARVRSSMVFFGQDSADNTKKNMTQVAAKGGGKFYSAGDEAALVDALVTTVNDLLDVSGSITAPGVAVNQLNRLNNLDQLFYAVFDPEVQRAYWPGNVKRYRLDIANEDIYDVNNQRAIDSATSFFKPTAKSWWSLDVDGEKARLGGAASVLPDPLSRKMFTYTGSLPSGSTSLTPINTGDAAFVSAGKTLTGITDSNEFINLMNWYRGFDLADLKSGLVAVGASTIKRNLLGGVLHSRPVLVNYGFSGTAAAAATDPDLQDNTLYFSTMEGTLHGVSAKTGVEYFAFIPGEKLAVLPKLYANPNQDLPEFGMDLTWSVVRKDSNGDGTPEKIYIYGGMRMGGRNYYALDVTDRASPKLLFALKGGTGSFAKMGQTWSQPVVASMRVSGTVKTVLVFGGGYDPQHETENTVFSSDTMGNAIYIVDAETGSLITSITDSNNSDMKFAIPSQPKTIDVDGDGLADNIYVGDLGGQVFRVDLDNRPTASTLVARVKTLAKLGQTGSGGSGVSDQRRFYEPATVALFKDTAGKIYAAVGLGSGYRSHPLNEATTDYFFTLFDYDVPRADILTAASSSLQPTIQNSDLVSVVPNASVSVSVAGKKGWYLTFPDTGEKVLNSGLIFQNTLVFASYVPSVVGGDVCAPVVGRSKLYRVSLVGGVPTGVTVKDAAVFGMGGDPQLVVLPDTLKPGTSDIGIVTGTDVETFGSGMSAGLRRTRWMEKVKQ